MTKLTYSQSKPSDISRDIDNANSETETIQTLSTDNMNASDESVEHSQAHTIAVDDSSRIWLPLAVVVILSLLTGWGVAELLPIRMAWAAGLTVFCIALWATSIVPEYWVVFVFFFIAIVFKVGSPQTVLSGFYSSTYWLFLGGVILGASIRYTGLDKRIAVMISSVLGKRYAQMIGGIVIFSVLLAFVIPSAMGRIALLLPIVTGLTGHLGYKPGSHGYFGMLMATSFGTCIPAFTILPANAPNMVLAGMAETLYHYQLSYWDYLLLHFPVLGLMKAAVLVGLIVWMFPDHDPKDAPVAEHQMPPVTAVEKQLISLLFICLLCWLTDSIHHVSPGWVGLGAAIICLWPGLKLTSPRCLNEEVNYGALFFVAGVLGLGAVISETGLGTAVVHSLSAHVDFSAGHPFWNVTLLSAISTFVAIVTNLPGVPAVMTPVAQDFAHMAGLSLTAVLMTQVIAFSNVFLPYQSAPLLTVIQMANLPARAAARLCLSLFVVTILVLFPIDLLWWRLLGII